MIVVKLMGGFGNQLFQYAAGRALALARSEDLLLDLSFLNADPRGAYTKRAFELDQVKYIAQLATENDLKNFAVSGFLDRALNKAGLKSHKVFNETQMSYSPAFEKLPKNVLLNGYWQSEKYFSKIRKELLLEISPLYEFTDNGKALIQKISNGKSVSVHVRRGDYVDLQNANDFHGTCDMDYYKTALAKLNEQHSDLQYFIFSDDIKWCQQQFTFLDKVEFIEPQVGKNSSEDLFIMSKCKHNVIANSSYSWWAAWLNKDPGTIIAPKKWFRKGNSRTFDLIPVKWIRV
jgi:hypothetical protein